MIRFLVIVAFASVSLSVSDCSAQMRGWLKRNPVAQSQVAPQWRQPVAVPQDSWNQVANSSQSQPYKFPTNRYFENRNPVISRILDGKMTNNFRDPAEVDSRYIGGFHQSHFDNIGIPNGDIGIRGNALNWRTW